MKRILLIFAALFVLLLSGCCQHEWAPAECEVPELCAKCQETQGEALGHDWVAATCEASETCTRCSATQGNALGHDWAAATCEAAETCTRCAATQGDALGHQLGKWAPLAGGTKMSQSCTVCGAEDIQEMDWLTYLNSMITGLWVLEYSYMDKYDAEIPPANWELSYLRYFEFFEDGSVRMYLDSIFGADAGIVEGTYRIEAYPDGSYTSYTITLIPDIATVIETGIKALPLRFCANRKAFPGDLYSYLRQYEMDNSHFRYSSADPEFITVSYDPMEMGTLDRLYMISDHGEQGLLEEVFAPVDPEEPIVQYASMLSRTWVSTGEDGLTLEFSDLGTFTSNDPTISGYWRIANVSWSPNYPHKYHYGLYLTSSRRDLYTSFGAGLTCDEEYFNPCELTFKTETTEEETCYTLVPADALPTNYLEQHLSEEEKESLINAILGTWNVTPEDTADGAEIPEELTFTFAPDGTFSCSAPLSLSGTWEIYHWSKNSVNESFWQYDLTISEEETISLCISEDGGQRILSIYLPQADGSRQEYSGTMLP